ncbi:hypothetical protein D3C72_1502060 [compost metagenome]
MHVDAEYLRRRRRVAHGPHGQAGTALDQVVHQPEQHHHQRPGEVVIALRRIQHEAEQRQLGDATDAQRAAGQPVPLKEQHIGDAADCQRRKRQEEPAQAQHRHADRRRQYRAGQQARRGTGQRRPAQRRGAVRRSIGADAVERGLRQVDDAALPEQQAHAQAAHRQDGGEVEQVEVMPRQQLPGQRPRHHGGHHQQARGVR